MAFKLNDHNTQGPKKVFPAIEKPSFNFPSIGSELHHHHHQHDHYRNDDGNVDCNGGDDDDVDCHCHNITSSKSSLSQPLSTGAQTIRKSYDLLPFLRKRFRLFPDAAFNIVGFVGTVGVVGNVG